MRVKIAEYIHIWGLRLQVPVASQRQKNPAPRMRSRKRPVPRTVRLLRIFRAPSRRENHRDDSTPDRRFHAARATKLQFAKLAKAKEARNASMPANERPASRIARTIPA